MKRNEQKEPKLSICYWRISVTLGSGIAGFNCMEEGNEGWGAERLGLTNKEEKEGGIRRRGKEVG